MSPISWPVWELTDTSIQPQLRAWNEPHRIPAQWDSGVGTREVGRAGKFGKIVRFCPSRSEKTKITYQIIKELELVFPIALNS